MSPAQRAAWLKRNPLPAGYGLIHVSELDAMHDQLVLHREAMEKIGALLGRTSSPPRGTLLRR